MSVNYVVSQNRSTAERLYAQMKPVLDSVEAMSEATLKELHFRLYNCHAWVVPIDGVFVLRSYDTAVAWYEPDSNSFYELGRYSATTYQHVRKFEDYMYYEKHYSRAYNGTTYKLNLVDNWGCYEAPIPWNENWFKW